MNTMEKNAAFADLDVLLDASMDDVEDLPPLGVPPTGHYNLSLTVERKPVSEKDALVFSYEIEAINELADDGEAADVKVGQKFMINIVTTKKDGTPNPMAPAQLKALVLPIGQGMGVDMSQAGAVRSLLPRLKDIKLAAAVKRRPNRKNPEFPNADLKDVIVL